MPQNRQTTRAAATETEARRHSGLATAGGFLAFLLLMALPPPEGMEPEAWRVAAVAVLMAIWWVTEALPLAVTALVPLVLLPLVGATDAKGAAAPYADPVIFLFLGGFVLGLALQRWNLHRRVALTIIGWLGTRPARLVGGFMLATGFLSMWVSNTATAVMMLPVALSVITLLEDGKEAAADDIADPARRNFAVSLLLGVAYGASIGGLGTLIGTPPNALLAAYMEQSHGVQVGFAQWMIVGLPLVAVLMVLAWLLLTRVLFPVPDSLAGGAGGAIREELASLGPMSREERLVGLVFLATAAAWVSRPLLQGLVPGLNDTAIAIAAAIVLFIIPARTAEGGALMGWDAAGRLPWGVLLLFGGGLALASAISGSGLAAWLGQALAGLESLPVVLVILIATAGVIFLTELTSNTATAATFLPLVGSVAAGIGLDPFLLTVPVALAASCAFMLPVATPPNAIVYGSGHLTIPTMARAGLWLNLVATALIVLVTWVLVPLILRTPAGAG